VLLVQQRPEFVQAVLKRVDEAIQNGQLQVDEGAEIAVQPLQADETVFFSHGGDDCGLRA
jgi:ABC-type nitrate/sulfonate/bicarbonate transport system substrate-binding protein